MNRWSSIEAPLRGNLLVEASAGTGKTYAITTLFVRLIVERGLGVDEILVVTFTEAATAELRGRIRSRLRDAARVFAARVADEGDPGSDDELWALASRSEDPRRDHQRLELALSEVDEAAISTIHGFCHRVLTDAAFESGADFELELQNDTRALAEEVLFDFWARTLADADPREVRALADAKVRPSSCRRLADAALRSADLRVLPDESVRPELPPLGPVEMAFSRLERAWDREAVRQAIAGSAALNKNRYRPGAIDRWVEEVDAFLAAGPGALTGEMTWLTKLSARELERSVTKKFTGEHPRHPFFDACQVMRGEAERMAKWASDFALWFRRALVAEVRRTLPARKEALGIMAFDDLLTRVDDALRGPRAERLAAAVRRRHPVALIDEFQDTDPVQYRIFARIWPEGTRLFIGDPKQAIYAFRGADVFAYLGAASEVPPKKRFTMSVNWRSDPSLLTAVETLFSRLPAPFVMPEIDFRPVAPRPGAQDRFDPGPAEALVGRAPLSFRFVPRDDEGKMPADRVAAIDDAVATEIATLLESGATLGGRPITPGDIAVLTRKNREAFTIQRALRRLRVPSVVLGDQSVFEDDHPEARELERVLAAIAEPTHTPRVRAALCTELIGLTAADLYGLDRDPDDADGADGRADDWDRWIGRFRTFNAIWAQRGFIQMIHALLEEADVERRLLAFEDGERRLTNLRHLIELLHRAAVTEHLGPAALLQWLATQRSPDNARLRTEAAQVRLESDEHAVKLTTVHRSKGLEYPIVFCPHLWDGLLLFGDELRALEIHQDGEAVLHLDVDKGSDTHRRALWERLAENARLLYVALTRAKHRTVVVWGGLPRYETSALGYLLHGPPTSGVEVDALAAALKRADDARLRSDLAELVARSDGALEVLDLEPRERAPLAPSATPTVDLEARVAPRPLQRWWRTASFSELSSFRATGAGEGRDRDEHQPVLPPEPLGRRAAREIVSLIDFPRGATAGTFFHAVLERIDFTAGAGPERDELIARQLRGHGYDPDAHGALVSRALDEILATTIQPGSGRRGFSLRDVPRSSRLDELEFYLPVGTASSRTILPRGTQLSLLFPDAPTGAEAMPVGRVTADQLAAVFTDHPSKTLDPGYAERVARLEFIPLEGFLKGFIDLVTVVDGRWYVVDYKTNHLGDRVGDYARARLPTAMAHGHYYLQSHLYALAVHRYLSRRLPGYRYDKSFGGILYLFVKGMHPEAGSDYGVFFDRPPLPRLDALGELLDRPARRGGGL